MLTSSTSKMQPDMQLHQLAAMLWRRRSFILKWLCAGLFLGLLLGLITSRKYTAKAYVVVDPAPATMSVGQLAALPGANLVNDSEVESHTTIIVSRDHLLKVLAKLRGVEGLTAATKERLETITIDDMELSAKVFQERKSRAIAVTYTAKVPGEAAVIANVMATLYVATQSDRRKADKSGAPVEQQVATLRHQLSLARSAHTDRKRQLERLLDIQGRGGNVEALVAALDTPLLAQLGRDEVTLVKARADLLKIVREIDPKVKVIDTEIENARLKASQEVQHAIRQVETEVSVAAARVRVLQGRMQSMEAARNDAREIQGVSVASPKSAVGTATFSSILKTQHQSIFEADSGSSVRLESISDAPTMPSNINPFLFAIPAAILFGLAGGLMATTLEALDRTLRGRRDIDEVLGLSCANLIPAAAPSTSGTKKLVIDPFSPNGEALRALVIDILGIDRAKAVPKSILITSSTAVENKAELAIGFAATAAALGRKVILLDLEFRRPTIGTLLQTLGATGVREVLEGGALEGNIMRDEALGFDYLSIAGERIDPLRYFTGTQVPDLLRKLGERYDSIIVEGGPLLVAPEQRLLPTMTSIVLLAVKWGGTRRETAKNALDQLRHAAAVEAGAKAIDIRAVVTDVDLDAHAAYQFGDSAESMARELQKQRPNWKARWKANFKSMFLRGHSMFRKRLTTPF
jgi:polysaccharide biosynthesis transport protein